MEKQEITKQISWVFTNFTLKIEAMAASTSNAITEKMGTPTTCTGKKE